MALQAAMFGSCCRSAWIIQRWAAEGLECWQSVIREDERSRPGRMLWRIGSQLSACRASECIGATDDETGSNRSSPDLAAERSQLRQSFDSGRDRCGAYI